MAGVPPQYRVYRESLPGGLYMFFAKVFLVCQERSNNPLPFRGGFTATADLAIQFAAMEAICRLCDIDSVM